MLAIAGLGSTELIVIMGIFVLLFGAAKIPALARSVGKSINEFKKGMSEGAKGDSEPEVEKKDAPSQPEAASKDKKE